jgi:hypothetical protein
MATSALGRLVHFRTTGANPAMQIIANVGIGTTSPQTKLQVVYTDTHTSI